MQLKYKGGSDAYELVADDLKRHGVEGFTKTRWDLANNFTAEVSDDAADKILELMPDDFESVDASSSDEDDSEPDSGKPKGRRNS